MTSNIFLTELAQRLNLKNFRGVFMRDELPKEPLTQTDRGACAPSQESGIMNFDTVEKAGSHWVAWYKSKKKHYYFDSYGTAVPDELREYFKNKKIHYSDFMIQSMSSDICGELCIAFIYLMDYSGKSFQEIVNVLRKEPT